MSLKSWKKEFYPKPVHMCKYSEAGKYTELKWVGLSKKNLKKHKGTKYGYYIDFEDGEFRIDGDSCMWCKMAHDCNECLGIVNNVYCGNSFNDWVRTGKVKPMLQWIRKARKYNREHGLGD